MGRQKRKEYAFYAVLAGTFLLIAGAYGSGEKSVQQNAKEMGAVAEKAVAEPEYVPAVRLYAGIFTKLDGEEYAVIEKNKDILVAAANRGYFDESAHFPLYRQAGQRKVQRIHAALYICSQGICGDGKTGRNGTV